MKLELRNFVGGEHADPVEGERADLVDPSTGEVFGTAPVFGAEDVSRACGFAATAFEAWRETTPSQRQRALLAFADLVEEHADELVRAESRNTGQCVLVGSRSTPA